MNDEITAYDAARLASELDPLALPSCSLAEPKDLPTVRGVYFIIQKDLIVYIGATVNLRQRWASNIVTAFIDRPNARISYLEIANKEQAVLREVERACIQRFQPKFNGHLTRPENRAISRNQRWAASGRGYRERLNAADVLYGR